MCDLTGRDLDRQIAEALGWKDVHFDPATTELVHGKNIWVRATVPNFHASVDALREMEPEAIDLSITQDDDKHPWWCTYWERSPDMDWEMAVQEIGTTEPEARARALLAWLTRDSGRLKRDKEETK